ncbi:hypothetical protein BDY19DRAFT_901416 [Irpex rosettiformis]|uniref:Uncharacterized protein n=1 Tax=Irpex rosettiformis TaxID=378272 RepID=A0ACB8UIK7_9APHY|nr:hypothetical protein BDY19DRAFT_901416 [Irpex rosettiformis]
MFDAMLNCCSRDRQWIASGSFDRTIKLWDLHRTNQDPLVTLHSPESAGAKASVNPRASRPDVGSTVREEQALLMSLATQKCPHTFTHHADSVWSLFSSHPSLEVFNSGDRSGIVCKTASTRLWPWTIIFYKRLLEAPVRWRVPGRRATRLDLNQEDITRLSPIDSPGERHSVSPSPSQYAVTTRRNSDIDREGEETWYGIPFESLVKLTSPNEGYSSFGMSRGRDPEISTLYSAASIASVPRVMRSPLSSVFYQTVNNPSTMVPRSMSPIPSESIQQRSHAEETIHPLRTARAESAIWRRTPCHCIAYRTKSYMGITDLVHALTVNTVGEVAVWDLIRGSCLGRFSKDDIIEAGMCESTKSEGSEQEVDRNPREALDAVKERIEGEAVVVSWASVDTKTGLLTVHLNERCFEAEIYADEAGFGHDRHFSDEARINVGKWMLRNLFIYFVRDQHRTGTKRNRDSTSTDGHGQRVHRTNTPHHIDIPSTSPERTHARSPSDGSRRRSQTSKSATIISSTSMVPAVAPAVTPPAVRSSPLLTPMIPLAASSVRDSVLAPIPQSPVIADATPVPRRPNTAESGSNGNRTSDYFSLRTRRPSVSASSPAGPSSPDDFSGWSTPKPGDPTILQTPTTPGGGLMGRLKAFGKGTKRHASEGPGVVHGSQETETGVSINDDAVPMPKTPLQILLSGPLNPPISNEAPTLSLPPQMPLLISEESPSGSGWMILYRGQVSSTGQDARLLEEVMPFWLLEYLLVNKIPAVPTVKISFVLLPWKNKDTNDEPLPELLNTAQSKLTASRFLRVRKLTQHVQDKLDRIASSTISRPATAANTPRSSLDARSLKSVVRNDAIRAEDQYEILCDSMVLPLDMTLAAVRQFVWRSAGELVMYYRRKVSSP